MPRGDPLVLAAPPGILLDEPLQSPSGGLLAASRNGVVRFGQLRARPGLNAVGPALDERVLGSLWFRDPAETSRLVVGTPSRWYAFNNAAQTWDDLSGGSLLGGSPTMPVTLVYYAQATQLATAPRVIGVNDVDLPRKWDPATASYAVLANAPVARTVGVGAGRVMFGYIRAGGDVFPNRVQWTQAGNSEVAPALAFNDLTDTPDPVVAIRGLGRRAVAIHKEFAQVLAIAQPGSDATAWEFATLDQQPGPLGPGAVCIGPGGTVHVYLGLDGNLYQFDGLRATLLAPTAALIQGRLAVGTRTLTSAVYNPQEGEVWVAVPLDADLVPTHLLVYSFRTRGVYLADLPSGLPVSTLGLWFAETETVTDALPDVPTDDLDDVPTDTLGLSSRGLFAIAGTPTAVFTWEGPTDAGSALSLDWRILLPVTPGQRWEVDGLEAQVEPVDVAITLSVLVGETLDSLTETVLGTINPALHETTVSRQDPLSGRVVVIRLSASTSQAVRLRRLEAFAWPRKLAT